jgi:hypothetical protein
MKKLLLITGLIFAYTQMKSQSNLQFNQPIFYGGAYSVGGGWGTCGSSPTFTVPEGKVWKIEKYPANSEMIINDVGVDNTGNALSIIWLKANDTIRFSACNTQNAYGGNHSYFVNGIEFNITP